MVAALDDWASVRRVRREDPAGTGVLAEVARVADPDPWRNDLRAALALPDRAAARRAEGPGGHGEFRRAGCRQPRPTGQVADQRGRGRHGRVLVVAQRRHAGDVRINYDLAGGRCVGPNRRDEAIRFYTATRIRPRRPISWLTPCLPVANRTRRSKFCRASRRLAERRRAPGVPGQGVALLEKADRDNRLPITASRSGNCARRSGSSPTAPRPTRFSAICSGMLSTTTPGRSPCTERGTSWGPSSPTTARPRRSGLRRPSGWRRWTGRMPALLNARTGHRAPPERLTLAQMCYDTNHHARRRRGSGPRQLEADPNSATIARLCIANTPRAPPP